MFDTGPKDHTVAWLAERLCCDKRNVYRIFNRDNIDIQQLDRLGKILDHNFFVDLMGEESKSDNSELKQESERFR